MTQRQCVFCDCIIEEGLIKCPKCGFGAFKIQTYTYDKKDTWKEMIDNKISKWFLGWPGRLDVIRSLFAIDLKKIVVIDTVCFGADEHSCLGHIQKNFQCQKLSDKDAKHFTDHLNGYILRDHTGNAVVLGFHEDIGLIITALGFGTGIIALITAIINLLSSKKSNQASYNYLISVKKYKNGILVKDTKIEIPKEDINVNTYINVIDMTVRSNNIRQGSGTANAIKAPKKDP